MKKLLLALIAVLLLVGLVSCGNVEDKVFTEGIFKFFKIRETSVYDLTSGSDKATIVSSNWSEVGLKVPTVVYVNSDATTSTSFTPGSTNAAYITVDGKTATISFAD